MPAKNIFVGKKVSKQLLKTSPFIHKRLIKALNAIKENPASGIKLHGEVKNYCKFRVGDYRIVYRFNSKKKIVYVVKIEHRQGVYK